MAFRRGEYLWLSDFAHGSRTLRLVVATRDFESVPLFRTSPGKYALKLNSKRWRGVPPYAVMIADVLARVITVYDQEFCEATLTLKRANAANREIFGTIDFNELEPLGELEPLAEPPEPNRVIDLFRAK